MRATRFVSMACVALVCAMPLAAQAQEPDPSTVTRLVASPAELALRVGESVPLTVSALDARGTVVDIPIRVSAPRRALRIVDGAVEALAAGEYELRAMVVMPGSGSPVTELTVPVVVDWPAIADVEIHTAASTFYLGSTARYTAVARHADGSERPSPEIGWSTTDPAVAMVDPFGNVTARQVGSVTVSASVEGVRGSLEVTTVPFPATSIELTGGADEALTGDVLQYVATVRGPAGEVVHDALVSWSLAYLADDSIVAPAGPGQVDNGRFVADWPGVYTVVASAGNLTTRSSIRASRRNAVQKLEVVGQGRESRVFTTDLWIWEGLDGRDYALTGSKMGNGGSRVTLG